MRGDTYLLDELGALKISSASADEVRDAVLSSESSESKAETGVLRNDCYDANWHRRPESSFGMTRQVAVKT